MVAGSHRNFDMVLVGIYMKSAEGRLSRRRVQITEGGQYNCEGVVHRAPPPRYQGKLFTRNIVIRPRDTLYFIGFEPKRRTS